MMHYKAPITYSLIFASRMPLQMAEHLAGAPMVKKPLSPESTSAKS